MRPSVPARVALVLLGAYKALSANRSPACRFVPSCSEYAAEALRRFGLRAALPLVVRRLARCRPGGPFGLDPVPDDLTTTGRRARRWAR
jgi:putative membrane protein insertion efficiency factor